MISISIELKVVEIVVKSEAKKERVRLKAIFAHVRFLYQKRERCE